MLDVTGTATSVTTDKETVAAVSRVRFLSYYMELLIVNVWMPTFVSLMYNENSLIHFHYSFWVFTDHRWQMHIASLSPQDNHNNPTT